MKSSSLLVPLNLKTLLLIVVLAISGIAHGLNMFKYPYYEDDEGTYMSQAWSLVTQRQLSPYTYTYDHAPGGWMLIAIWSILTGGFFTFGFSVNSGRVLMLIIHLISSLFLYLIVKRLTNKPLLSALAVLVFSLSPLAIYFQRRVLLDNIMVLWLLISLFITLIQPFNVNRILLSGLFFGLAVITKENTIIFIPLFWYLVYKFSSVRKLSSLIYWSLAVSLPVLIYLAYATSRGELFAFGMPFGGISPHVSLIGTWRDQLSRPSGNTLSDSLRSWFANDPILLVTGIFASLVNIYFGIKNLPNRIVALFSILYILFIVRGGVVFEFYIIPLVPIFALNIALTVWCLNDIVATLGRNSFTNLFRLGAFFISLALVFYDFINYSQKIKSGYNLFTSDQTTPQIAAVNWVLSQSSPESLYVIDNYGYVDLHQRQGNHFKRADYYWKADKDPAITDQVLNNNSQKINYLMVTPQLITDINTGALPLTAAAYNNSTPVASFHNDGWGVDVRKVNK